MYLHKSITAAKFLQKHFVRLLSRTILRSVHCICTIPKTIGYERHVEDEALATRSLLTKIELQEFFKLKRNSPSDILKPSRYCALRVPHYYLYSLITITHT